MEIKFDELVDSWQALVGPQSAVERRLAYLAARAEFEAWSRPQRTGELERAVRLLAQVRSIRPLAPVTPEDEEPAAAERPARARAPFSEPDPRLRTRLRLVSSR